MADRPVTFAGEGRDVTLAGTIAVPPGPGPHPAAVLVGGFGPNEPRRRASATAATGAYRGWARELAERGLAVLRYDKRGTGELGRRGAQLARRAAPRRRRRRGRPRPRAPAGRGPGSA